MNLRIAIVGPGRLGTALVPALRAAGHDVTGPHGRGFDGAGADLVLLCVPDAAIGEAAAAVAPGPIVGHCSGATGLGCLGERERLGLHPLMTVTPSGALFGGAGCAIGGSSHRARSLARSLAGDLGMLPFDLADEDRAAYHAAAAIASNFLITVETAAAKLAATAGVPREALVPLARASLENWAALDTDGALTGPIARGDEVTVTRQREAIVTRMPAYAALFDSLADVTRGLVEQSGRAGSRARHAPLERLADGMTTLRTVAGLREALAGERERGRSVALVPTMGALHDGHLSLIRAARADHDVVVVSLFVNPAQFDDGTDLAAYPRDEAQDARLAGEAGADLLFAPDVDELYPDGFATTVSLRGPLVETLEGEHRGVGHFAGVATVVAKLFGIAAPDAAYFGEKDAQQLLVIRRMARDLDMPVEIVACPTVRGPDGLALSSRNRHLSGPERAGALGLSRALGEVAEGLAEERFADRRGAEDAGLAVLHGHGLKAEYFCLVDPGTMVPAGTLSGDLLIVTAARAGAVRLIDNLSLRLPAASSHSNPIIDVESEVATLLA